MSKPQDSFVEDVREGSVSGKELPPLHDPIIATFPVS